MSEEKETLALSMSRNVGVNIWEGEFAVAASGDSDLWTVALYLITNRHNRWGLGLYRLPLSYISEDTGIAIETVKRCVQIAIRTGFVRHHNASKTVFVVENARHSWGPDPNPKAKQVMKLVSGLETVFTELAKSPLVHDFCERYEDQWERVFNALETRPERVLNASGTPPININKTKKDKSSERARAREESPEPELEDGYEDHIDAFIKAYPKPVNRPLLERAWMATKRPPFKKLMARLEVWKASDRWKKKNGKYIHDAHNFIGDLRFEETPEPAKTSSKYGRIEVDSDEQYGDF